MRQLELGGARAQRGPMGDAAVGAHVCVFMRLYWNLVCRSSETGFSVTSFVYQRVIRQLTDNPTLQALHRITSGLPVIRPQSGAGGFCLSGALSERLWRFGINRKTSYYLPGWPTNLSFACSEADRAHKPGRWRFQFCSFPAQE
jgi:hypothetical protein